MSELPAGDKGDTGLGDGGNESFLDSFTDKDLGGNELLTGYTGDEGGGVEKLASDFVALKANQPSLPENAESYVFEAPEGMDERIVEGYNGLKAVAHDAGISQAGYDAIVKFDQDRAAAINTQIADLTKEAETAVKDDMGDKFEENLGKADKVLDLLGAKGLTEGAGNELVHQTELFKMLVKVADSISEDKLSGGNGPTKQSNKGSDGQKVIVYKDM